MNEQSERWEKAEAPTLVSVSHGWGIFRPATEDESRPWYIAIARTEADADAIIADHAAAARAEATEAALREALYNLVEVVWPEEMRNDPNFAPVEGSSVKVDVPAEYIIEALAALTSPALQSDTGTVD